MAPLQRFNERVARPTGNINFIHALPSARNAEALALLQAIAAQFKALMQEHSFYVNSLIEVPYNGEFAGRNFNNGEIIELVLFRPDGSFYPYQWLLAVMAHEVRDSQLVVRLMRD